MSTYVLTQRLDHMRHCSKPRSSITGESDDTDGVHWNLNICAQVQVQRSDVYSTNASTSDYTDQDPSVDKDCTSQLTNQRFI